MVVVLLVLSKHSQANTMLVNCSCHRLEQHAWAAGSVAVLHIYRIDFKTVQNCFPCEKAQDELQETIKRSRQQEHQWNCCNTQKVMLDALSRMEFPSPIPYYAPCP